MNLFYAAQISAGDCILSEDDAKHALKVLRLSEGDKVQVTDGRGNRYEGVLASADISNCRVEALNELPDKENRSYRLHIAIAPTKSANRFEWFLEKSCEIGIDNITPLVCERSERRKIQEMRQKKILIGAMKQSNQLVLPVLNPMLGFKDFLGTVDTGSANLFVASYAEGNKELSKVCRPGQDAVVLIGPEGDFSNSELDLALHHGFESVNLGRSRLRTETAGVVVANTVALVNNQSIS